MTEDNTSKTPQRGKGIPKYCSYWWTGQLMYLGAIVDNSRHTHYGLQLIFNREGKFRLLIDGSIIECSGAIIGAHCPHQLLSSSDSQFHLWIDNEDEVARTIAKQHLGKKNVKIIDSALLKRLRGCIDVPENFLGSCGQAREVYHKIVTELGGYSGHSGEAIDPRIQDAVKLLKDKYLARKVSIAELAGQVCLSESRLMHLFTGQIGIPPRRYVLWLRLMTAVRLAVQGKSFTEAAHSAGFADSAHLSRTYRRMYGLTLSHCVKYSQFVQVMSCF